MEAIKKARPAGGQGHFIRKITVATTMGPGIRVDPNAAQAMEEMSLARDLSADRRPSVNLLRPRQQAPRARRLNLLPRRRPSGHPVSTAPRLQGLHRLSASKSFAAARTGVQQVLVARRWR